MDGCRDFEKVLYQGEGKEERHLPAFLRHMGSGLHAETGCKKVYAGKAFERKTNSNMFKNPSKNIKAPFSLSQNLHICILTRIYPPKRIGPARGNYIAYFRVLVYSGHTEPLEHIMSPYVAVLISRDSKHLQNIRVVVCHVFRCRT